MNTVKIPNKKGTLIIAHRGLSGIEIENTCSSFVAAGNRSYFGIETDVHITADNKFIITHDDTTDRVGHESLEVEKSTLEELRNLKLYGHEDCPLSRDLFMPTLEEYIAICKRYGKAAVLELKNKFEPDKIDRIYEIIENMGYADDTIFISFNLENLTHIRNKHTRAHLQLLSLYINDKLFEAVKRYRLDVDVLYSVVYKEGVDIMHDAGVKVNCWTVDNVNDAQKLIDMGVDYITTNILE